MRRKRSSLVVGLLVVLPITGSTAFAQHGYPPVDVRALIDRIDSQETRIQGLEARLQTRGQFPHGSSAVPIGNQSATPRFASLETAPAEEAAEDPGWIDVSSEKWKMKYGGEIQGDYIMYAHQDAANQTAFGDIDNYFEFRRLRFWVAGTGYGVYDFKFQLEFEPEHEFTVRNATGTGPTTIAAAGVGIKDMYIGIHEIPLLGYVRFGQYYEPFGLEQLTSDKYVTFMERSLPFVFARHRQVGITAYNQSESESLIWAAGAFLPAIDSIEKQRLADDQGIDVVFRGVWTPYYESDGRCLLHLGGGYVFTDVTDQTARFRSRPEVHESATFLDTGSFDADRIHRGNLEAAMVRGPLSLQSEFYAVHTDGVNGTPDMEFYGAYAYVSYFLTGEHRVYRRQQGIFHRVTPHTNFFLVRTPSGSQAGWGAWETSARWSFLELDSPGLTSDTRGQLHDLTLGLTWYWTSHAKMTVNWIHAFNDIARVGRNEADILGTRIQLIF